MEAVHGMAPATKIVYVGAPNNFQDLDAALVHVVDRRLAQIVTNSYGFNTELLPRGFVKPYESILIEAAVTGIGVYFSSGDNSDESLVSGYVTVDWPASSPWVTAVGGTSIAIGAGNQYLFETGWGTTRSRWTDNSGNFCNGSPGVKWTPKPPGIWIYGSGGGVSRIFAEPSYQSGVVPQSVFDANGRVGRAVPDISALGDVTNVAARLTAQASAGEILMDARTYDAVTAQHPDAERRELELKGKSAPVEAFAVQVR